MLGRPLQWLGLLLIYDCCWVLVPLCPSREKCQERTGDIVSPEGGPPFPVEGWEQEDRISGVPVLLTKPSPRVYSSLSSRLLNFVACSTWERLVSAPFSPHHPGQLLVSILPLFP